MNVLKSIKNRSYEFLHDLFLLPKIIYFNFRTLPCKKAVKLPIYINYGVKIQEVHKGIIDINCDKLTRYMISIGRGGSEGIAVTSGGVISMKKSSRIEFRGSAQFHSGCRLWLDENAVAVFGHGFTANRNFTLFYNDKIEFGEDCMLGWNVEIIDGNAHTVINNGVQDCKNCVINVGNHVWIGANVKIGRSVTIGDNCIVAYGSTIVGGTFEDGSMLGGYPAKLIRQRVDWAK